MLMLEVLDIITNITFIINIIVIINNIIAYTVTVSCSKIQQDFFQQFIVIL